MTTIDLNCDMGESYGIWNLGADQDLIEVVTSANLACGFHAGDPTTLRIATEAAAQYSVAIGAQVSFPDLAGFGRRAMQIDPGELRDIVLYQIGALDGFARVAGSQVSYLKPHGALYHVTVGDPAAAEAVVAAAAAYDPSLAILGFPGSALLAAAEAAGLCAIPEAFADRAYLPDGRLQPRNQPGSVLGDPTEILHRALRIALDGEVLAVDGSVVSAPARSICVHSDTPDALRIARALRTGLTEAGITVQAFTADQPER